MSTLSRSAAKNEEVKLRVSAAEKTTLRKAAAKEAARFEKIADPELLRRRPRLRDRYLSEWLRRVALSAAKRVIENVPGPDDDRESPASSRPADRKGPSDAERDAAWQALEELTKEGWRSEAPYGDRDELHDR
jgi:uncharacterized protein (DUF1778 family)